MYREGHFGRLLEAAGVTFDVLSMLYVLNDEGSVRVGVAARVATKGSLLTLKAAIRRIVFELR